MDRRDILLTAATALALAGIKPAAAQPAPDRIVVTGHSGRIGSSLLRHWTEKTIIGLSLPGLGVTPTQAHDLRTYDDAWAGQFAGASCMVHLAGLLQNDFESNRGNAHINENVLRACIAHDVPKVIYASSAEVIAPMLALGVEMTWYSAEKLAGEHMLQAWTINKPGRFAHCMRFGHYVPGERLPLPDALKTSQLVMLDDDALHYWMGRALQEEIKPFDVWYAAGRLG